MKDILIPCDCEIGLPNATSVGLRLAEDLGASITGLGLIPLHPPAEAIAAHPGAPVVPAPAVDREREDAEAMRQRARRTKAYLGELTGTSGIPLRWDQREDTPDRLADWTAQAARPCDLTIIDRTPENPSESWTGIVERVVLESGRPALIIPKDLPGIDIGLRAVIGWDDSAAAARALHDAIPLLKESDAVRVVTVAGDGADAVQERDGAMLAVHLRSHGIAAVTHELVDGGSGVDTALLEQTAETGADMLVIGGFGKARWRETLFGSLTRKLVAESPVPVLVSH